MLIETDSKVTRHGISGESNFTIKATAKSFDLLLSGLYANKVGAVVRENCSNAYDSHRAAGKSDVPFTVKLPDRISPHFMIKDEGIGMSPEDLILNMSTIFQSTKETSNDDIGCMGLGSKSPFAITDTFNIVSNWEGMEYNYLVFRNEERKPSILELSARATDEPNGITISIPVKESDYKRFETELRSQLEFFPVKPIVEEYPSFSWFPSRVGTQIGSVFLSDKARGYSPVHLVVMGGVAYPIQIDNLVDEDLKTRLNEISTDSIINVNIGDVDIQPSREGMEYTEKTLDKITSNYNAFFVEYEKDIVEKLEECGSVYRAYRFLHDEFLNKQYWLNRKIEYRGKVLYDKTLGKNRGYHDKKEYDFFINSKTQKVWVDDPVQVTGSVTIGSNTTDLGPMVRQIERDANDNSFFLYKENSRKYNAVKLEGSGHRIDFLSLKDLEAGKLAFLLLDENKYQNFRVRDLINDQDYKSVILVRLNGKATNFDSFKELLTETLVDLSDVEEHIFYASEMDKPESNRTSTVGVVRGITVHYNHPQSRTFNSAHVTNLSEINPDGFYVLSMRGDMRDSDVNVSYSSVLNVAKSLGVPVYTIDSQGRSKIRKLEKLGLKHFSTFFNDVLGTVQFDSQTIARVVDLSTSKMVAEQFHYAELRKVKAFMKRVNFSDKTVEIFTELGNFSERSNLDIDVVGKQYAGALELYQLLSDKELLNQFKLNRKSIPNYNEFRLEFAKKLQEKWGVVKRFTILNHIDVTIPTRDLKKVFTLIESSN